MKKCHWRGTIRESTAKRIERVAQAKMRQGTKMHLALTAAAKSVLRCKPRRAEKGEGSLNYIQSIAGRVVWGS